MVIEKPCCAFSSHQSSVDHHQWKAKEEIMCPACMASAAVMAASVTSTGGIAALAVKIVRGKKNVPQDKTQNSTERRNGNGNDDDQQD
jgi:hypothetical protein